MGQWEVEQREVKQRAVEVVDVEGTEPEELHQLGVEVVDVKGMKELEELDRLEDVEA